MSISKNTAPAPEARTSQLPRTAIGLVLAVASAVIAWIVSEHAGFDAIGQGGINHTKSG